MSKFYTQILEPFCETLKRFPSRNAFFIDGTYYTYKQFADRIAAIRSQIRAIHTEEKVFALAIHDDIDTYASIFALWCEGKAYVPLHPNQPIERNQNIIQQVGTSFLIDSQANEDYSCNVIHTASLSSSLNQPQQCKAVEDDDLAYILFTSGSTGVPKGVPLSRKNLAAFIRAFNDVGYKIDESDRFLQCFDLTFDLSIMSYLVPLLHGACVYTVPYTGIKYISIVQLMTEHQLTFTLMTPSTIKYLQPYFDELQFPSMRYSLFCGEALATDVTIGWSKCLPNAEIHNVYGPTEDTIFCTVYRFNRNGKNVEHNGVLSIGTTMSSGQVIIVDENDKEVSGNQVGELCLSGDQLTNGYWRNPQKNAEAFWLSSSGIRYYRSGDLCYYGQDGNINFVGRKDSQVKIDGFRIELSEIEYHARQFLGQAAAIVLAYTNTEGTQSIAIFVESADDNSSSLKAYLAEKLPPYMIPHKFIYVEKFPVNSSNKIDRTALKQLIS